MEREFIQKLTSIVETNLANEQFGPEELARESGLSHSHLHRKLKSISNQNASQFIREVRLKKARELLLKGDLTVSEISYRVGFGSPTYFSRCFHEYFGVAPGEIRNHEPENEQEEHSVDFVPKKRQHLKILIGLVVGLIVLIPFSVFLINKGSKTAIKEKSIAVLPFVNYSPEEATTYIINGLQEEILDKLEKIEDLQVKSRTDVEKYKDAKLNISQIAKELKVNYILEGSGQKIGDNIRVRLQLIEAASGNHLWSKPYEEEVNDKTIFDILEEVALSVADELGTILTPDEKNQLTKRPTQNPAAYNNYLRGLDYLNIFNSSLNSEIAEVFKAKQCFEQAIKLDSTFSEVYERLGHIYIDLLYNTIQDRSIQSLYLDSGMMMIKKVFLYNPNSGFAYKLRGSYYYRTGMVEKANKDFDKAFELGPKNNYEILYARCWQFLETEDYVDALNYFYKGRILQPKEVLTVSALLLNVSSCLAALGFPDISHKYLEEYFKQTNDSLIYFYQIAEIERCSGNFKNALNYDLKCYEIDTAKTESLFVLIRDQVLCRDYTSAYKYLLEIENINLKTGRDFRVEDIFSGFICLKNGESKKADYYLKGIAKELLNEIESNRVGALKFYSYWHLAKIYSVMGDKPKALDNLKKLKNRKTNYAWLGTCLKSYPFFDFIRSEPEFIEILKDVESKYQKEHERAGKLLKEYGEDLKD